MSNFPAPPKLSPLWKDGTTDGANWFLLEDFLYVSDDANVVAVPAGFITDFASTPRPIWNIYPPWGVYGPAAILHDWAYWDQKASRDGADALLLQAMHALGVDAVTCKAIYEAVALAGQFAWDNNARLKAGGYTKMVDLPTQAASA